MLPSDGRPHLVALGDLYAEVVLPGDLIVVKFVGAAEASIVVRFQSLLEGHHIAVLLEFADLVTHLPHKLVLGQLEVELVLARGLFRLAFSVLLQKFQIDMGRDCASLVLQG